MYDEALDACEKKGGCRGSHAWVYAVAGKREDALKEIDRLRMKGSVSSWQIAAIYTGLGEKEQAFELLGKAVDERHSGASVVTA